MPSLSDSNSEYTGTLITALIELVSVRMAENMAEGAVEYERRVRG